MGTKLLLFDDLKGNFGPLTDRRPAFQLRTGSNTIATRISRALELPIAALYCAKHLPPLLAELYPNIPINQPFYEPDIIAVNGRWNALHHIHAIKSLPLGSALVCSQSSHVIAVRDSAENLTLVAEAQFDPDSLSDHLKIATLDPVPINMTTPQVTASKLDNIPDNSKDYLPPLLSRPWHIHDQLPQTLLTDLAHNNLPVIHPEEHINITAFGSHPMRVASTARLHPYVVVDAQYGPVVIDEYAEINPLTVLQGPCYIGPHSVLVSHTSIRRNTVVGPWCKLGGEIGSAIIQGYSNKVHDGFLGAALVGEWVNLGADTNVSNLKNTYGSVRIQLGPDEEPQDTNRTFHGPIIGDFVRTGIGTRVNTGAVLGTGCMFAGSHFTPKSAAPFGFYTDGPDGMVRSEYDLEKFIHTAKTMMARRDRTLTYAEECYLRELHAKNNPPVTT
ncbi:putative sugar nucleotidyl transferase [Poriferisphaera sp. WC338]|uniref:putative sugar nucleotidyl transferase n=1 Tax=Poriferisphaera sp. WC338 TaxID=3425129 RepID=UPI003D819C74